jgi:hypothetical protein
VASVREEQALEVSVQELGVLVQELAESAQAPERVQAQVPGPALARTMNEKHSHRRSIPQDTTIRKDPTCRHSTFDPEQDYPGRSIS